MSTIDLAIDADRLGRRYGRRWALVDVSLQIARGEVVMLVGRNGSGKSTLLRILATAIRADLGRAAIFGHDLVRGCDDIRKATGLLSHQSYLYESLSARENLEIVARLLGNDASHGALLPFLERVGLAARADDPVANFSAGMRKRLSFARLLMQAPSLVMLDEPYGQLDPPGFVLVDQVVRELHERGATVLIATHQLARGARLASRAFELEAGRLIWSGAAAEIATRGGVDGGGAE